MSKKSPKIAAFLATVTADPRHSPYYAGYFACFNAALYYEAHDVLEEMWLPVRKEAEGNFFKGLIQLAGAFVHLQKNRLRPSGNLFALAEANLAQYPDIHLDFDAAGARRLCREWIGKLEHSGFTVNPLTPESAPKLGLLP
ncbi:protein of unknown function [Verrucomicrobium sp. GAS474]|uniref:DUF309 domain-containing protein n=1 Tax=Verrucomicrobium sp. GAS474 TaxID=1882831 RepID=UPI000879AE8A|nr:DUF309 domain-containing protein [Verrucomicrobium sp. GAS474]SDT86885.1 protein of unknown function [Verrucomicrobium sp. GAS474]